MAQIQQLRQANLAQRRERQQALNQRRFNAAAPEPERVRADNDVAIWEGDEYSCSICMEDMVEHDRVLRLRCRHCFHANCWNGMQNATSDSCPNCRAGAEVIAIWHFIGARPDPTQGQPNLLNVGRIDGEVDIQTLATPRSLATDCEFGMPSSHNQAFPTFPRTAADAHNWQ